MDASQHTNSCKRPRADDNKSRSSQLVISSSEEATRHLDALSLALVCTLSKGARAFEATTSRRFVQLARSLNDPSERASSLLSWLEGRSVGLSVIQSSPGLADVLPPQMRNNFETWNIEWVSGYIRTLFCFNQSIDRSLATAQPSLVSSRIVRADCSISDKFGKNLKDVLFVSPPFWIHLPSYLSESQAQDSVISFFFFCLDISSKQS